MKMRVSFFSVLLFLFAHCGAAYSQSSQDPLQKTRGFLLNVHATTNQFKSLVGPNAVGAGFGLKLASSFKRFNIYLGFDETILSKDYSGAGYFELGTQFKFRSANPGLIPYAETGFSLQVSNYEINPQDDVSLFGAGFFLGGGVKYFIASNVAFETSLLFSYADSNEIIGERRNTDLISTRLQFGLSFYPFN